MLTNLVRVCVPHFKYIVAGTKSLNARQSINTSVYSDDITTALEPLLAAWDAWRRRLVSASSWVDVRSSLGLKLSAEISTQLSSVVVKRCLHVSLCLSLSFCHSDNSNQLLSYSEGSSIVVFCHLAVYYSIPVYPLSPLSVCSWTTFLYKHRRLHQHAYSLRLLVAISRRIIAIKASAISANALWSPLSLLTMDMPSMMHADEFELCYYRSHLGWRKIGIELVLRCHLPHATFPTWECFP